MKLITELVEQIDYKIICEEKTGKKDYFIEGVFLQSNIKNKNGRVYPKSVLQREVKRYNEEYICKNRAFGELSHPDSYTIHLPNVSHMITNLECDGDNFVGKAKILVDLPNGKIAKGLIDAGACLAVSSRGMGSLGVGEDPVGEIVQDDFTLVTAADIVADPSAPNAFVRGVMEGKEWVWNNGRIEERIVENIEKSIRKSPKKRLNEVSMQAFEQFMKEISKI